MFNVYLAEDGRAREFIGRAEDIFEAEHWAEMRRLPVSEEWQWASHRASGATRLYPGHEDEDAETEWLEASYCAVKIKDEQ